jgi:hypothetical protein
MLFNLLKKQTAESAAALVAKAEANLAQIKTDKAVIEQKLKDAATEHWVGTVASGENAPWTPPESLQKQLEAAAHKITAAEGVLESTRQNYERIVRVEAEKREAERQAKIKAIKADVRKKGGAIDRAMDHLVDAISAMKKAQAAAAKECPHELIEEFTLANNKLMPVLSRKLSQKCGAIPGLTDNRIIMDSRLETFVQHLPGVEK